MKKYIYAGAVSLFASFAISTIVSATVLPPPPPQFPTTSADCKKGGWENYNGLFKNQGDCVSFVATDGRNLPDGPNA